MPDPVPFDHSRAAAFEKRLVGALNYGALCLMTCLGHRTGLFDGMAEMPAAGSEAIAARCGLNERYVREWLGAMVASGVVDYDPRDGTYALPPEHAAFLTRAAMPLTWPFMRSIFHCSGPSKTMSLRASSRAVACLTHGSSASMRSWPKTAVRPCCRC